MTEKVMCAYCGIRPVRPAKRKSANGPGGRTKYCSVCKPIVKRESNILCTQRWHQRKRLTYVIDPISGEAVRGQTAFLTNIGRDYLILKQKGKIIGESESRHNRSMSMHIEEQ
jgi:hypothetical protein